MFFEIVSYFLPSVTSLSSVCRPISDWASCNHWSRNLAKYGKTVTFWNMHCWFVNCLYYPEYDFWEVNFDSKPINMDPGKSGKSLMNLHFNTEIWHIGPLYKVAEIEANMYFIPRLGEGRNIPTPRWRYLPPSVLCQYGISYIYAKSITLYLLYSVYSPKVEERTEAKITDDYCCDFINVTLVSKGSKKYCHS